MPRNKVILTLSFFSFIVILQFTIYHYSQTIDPIESYYKPKQYAKNAKKFSNLNVSWDELNKKLDEKLAEATEKKVTFCNSEHKQILEKKMQSQRCHSNTCLIKMEN